MNVQVCTSPIPYREKFSYLWGWEPRTVAPPPATHWRAASWDSVYSRREDEDPPYELEQRDYRDWEGHERDRQRGLDGGGRRVGRAGRNARGWGAADKMDFTQVVGAAMRQELGVRGERKKRIKCRRYMGMIL